MVNVEELFGDSKYVNAATVKEHGNLIKMLGDGELYTFERNKRTVLKFPVEFTKDNVTKTWTANNTSLKTLAKAWGNNTEDWNYPCIVELYLVNMLVQGQMKEVIFGKPAPQQKLKGEA